MSSDAAILTGDFVRSTRAAPGELESAFAALGEACAVISEWQGEDVALTRFRGDGWQCRLVRPALALRSALFVVAWLKARGPGLETRVAVGLGTVARPGSGDLRDADGPAFHRSGRALDAMRRNRRLSIAAEGAAELAGPVHALADALSRRWTHAQAEALTDALCPDAPTQAQIAARLDITQQSVVDRLDAAGFWALEETFEDVEARG